MHPFHCSQCQATVYFENDRCVSCQALLGYQPAEDRMLAFDASTEGQSQGVAEHPTPDAPSTTDAPGDGAWRALGQPDEGLRLQPCRNRTLHGMCNWMLDAGDPHALCRSCRLTRVIPNLDQIGNRERWQLIEQAKRRLLHTLLALGLAPEPKLGPDDAMGLEIRLLETQPGQAPVHTGHHGGVITLNIAEADDAQREWLRVQMGEPTRTLLGHLRHEAAHYLHYRWIEGTDLEAEFRAVFGDDRADYAAALARHYAQGAPADWPTHCVSAYASAHPWEDWAETTTHVLLVLDSLQTATAWGLRLDGAAQAAPAMRNIASAADLDGLVREQWLPVARFLNAMHRSLGQRDSYPFLLPPEVMGKMVAVQRLLRQAAERARSHAD